MNRPIMTVFSFLISYLQGPLVVLGRWFSFYKNSNLVGDAFNDGLCPFDDSKSVWNLFLMFLICNCAVWFKKWSWIYSIIVFLCPFLCFLVWMYLSNPQRSSNVPTTCKISLEQYSPWKLPESRENVVCLFSWSHHQARHNLNYLYFWRKFV